MICSNSSNAVYDGRLAYVPALEDILVWDIKKGQMVSAANSQLRKSLTESFSLLCGTRLVIGLKSHAFTVPQSRKLLLLVMRTVPFDFGTLSVVLLQ